MAFHTFFFRAIDHVYYCRQNCRKETKFSDCDFDIRRDVAYGNDPTSRLDVYRIRGKEKLPVIFYLHGGGFEAGDKRCRTALSKWFATLGYVVFNVNYCLAPEHKFPEQHIQLASAVNFMCRNAERFGADLNRAVVGGDSAGAYMAAFLACLCGNRQLQSSLGVSLDFNFGAAILNSGVYDMVKLARSKMMFNLGKYVFRDVTGISCEEAEAYPWRSLLYIPSLITPEFPQTFVTYAQHDSLCIGQTDVLLPALRQHNIPTEVFCAKSKADDHCFSLMWRSPAARRSNQLLADFLRRFANGAGVCGMNILE